ncbi:sugar phosphate nucleotidyltransferase [Butyricimonas muris]|uniref:sugar phosphate nucleotidyltransferase n=1 Tax=Butyricimonas muris TaxID=3378067 RepID=UPI0039676CC8
METKKNKTTLLIMAAGMGSRFGSLKQLALLGPHKKTLLHYSIYNAVHAGFDKIVFIIRRSFEEEFKEAVGKYAESLVETVYCFQEMDRLPGNMPPIEREKPWGTAHAIWSAKDSINEPFIAINADDFYGRDAFVKMHDFIANNPDENCFSLAGYRLAATLSENGTVSRGVCTADKDNFLTSITERTKIGREGAVIKDMDSGVILHEDDVVSMNFWGFTPMLFGEIEKQFVDFYHANSNNPKSEIYIPFVVDELIKQKTVKVKVLNTSAKWFGVTYKEDTELVNNALQKFDGEGLYTDMGK